MTTLAFLLIFPFFLFSQLLIQLQFVNPSILSSFSFWLFFSLPLLLLEFVKCKAYQFLPRLLALRSILLFLLLASSIVFYGYSQGVDTEVTFSFIAIIARAIPLFLFAFLFDFQSSENRGAILFVFILYSLSVAIGSPSGTLVSGAIYYDGSIFELDYQQTACLYLLLAIYLFVNESTAFRYFIYLTSLAVLFLIGARSEFYSLPLIILLSEFIQRRSIISFLFLYAFFSSVSLIALNLLPEILDSRIFAIISSASEASMDTRFELTQNALSTIANNPIIGGYNTYLPGNYSHNLLSIWVDFGLLGFLLFVFAFALQVKYSLKIKPYFGSSYTLQAVHSLTLYSLVFLLFTAKSYSYALIPICIGLYCRCRFRDRYSPSSKLLPDLL